MKDHPRKITRFQATNHEPQQCFWWFHGRLVPCWKPGKAQSILVSFFFRFPAHCDNDAWQKNCCRQVGMGLCCHLLGRLFHYLHGFLRPSWLFGISSINSITQVVVVCVVFSVRWKEMQQLQVAFGEARFVFFVMMV